MNSYPVFMSGSLPENAISATITFGTVEERDSAIISALTALPEMFYAGFVNMLLNDDPNGALQVAGSIALAVGPQAALRALAPTTLYHFTSNAGYAGIVSSGQIIPGAGVTGWGVYGTALPRAATVSWAGVSTEAMVSFSPGLEAVYPGLVPGLWWRVVPAVTTIGSHGVPINPIP